jgi:hypothetical protein
MKINVVNFQPNSDDVAYLEDVFGMLSDRFDEESSFVVNIAKDGDHYKAVATIVMDKRAVQGEMKARTLQILAPSLVVELKAKLAMASQQDSDLFAHISA